MSTILAEEGTPLPKKTHNPDLVLHLRERLHTLQPHTADTTLDRLAQELSWEIHRLVDFFVPPKLQEAVLHRNHLPEKWPLQNEIFSYISAELEDQKTLWPPGVAVQSMAEWTEKPLNKVSGRQKVGSILLQLTKKGLNLKVEPRSILEVEEERGIGIWDLVPVGDQPVPVLGIALIYQAFQDVEAGIRRPVIAIDASQQHHSLLSNMRDWPQDRIRHRGGLMEAQATPDDLSRIELFSAGEPVQLNLPWNEQSPHDSTIEALRRLRGSKGLRHWCALQRLFSVEGRRQGWVRWLLDEHLDAMGYDERQIRDQKVRDEAAAEVEALAALELAVYGKDKVLRHRAPLLLVGNRHERLVESQWKLDGMELRINDMLYRGVRESNGKIGNNWMPAPTELARLDHVRQPYVHALGLVFSIRVRWRLGEGESHLALKGRNLLGMAGIELQPGRPKRAWTSLKETLQSLEQIGLLQEFRWDSDEESWSLDGTCRMYPSAWLLDRVRYGVVVAEASPEDDRPLTGKELKLWREKRGWSQRELAKKLGMNQGSIHTAEAQAEHMLGSRLRKRLQQLSEELSPQQTPLGEDEE